MRNCLGRSGGCRRDRRAWLRCPWAVAGPGRASRRRADQRHKPHWCGGCRRDRRAWLRCPWAAAGPGRTTSRRAEPPISHHAPPVWRAPEGPADRAAVPVGGGRARTKQKSHIISYGHFWRPPRNVAIATTLLHDLKYPQGNYVRNWRGGIAERQGLAAVLAGGGRAWPGFETTRRAKLAARTARGRAAAHQHTQRPGPQNGTRGSPPGPPRVHATSSHSARSRARALSAAEQPPPRRPGPR